MFHLSEQEFQKQMEKAQQRNESLLRIQELRKERNKYSQRKKLPTSKLITYYLFIVLNVVLVYSMVVMYKFQDLSYLGALITDIAAQVITYFIYAQKSRAENTVGGITYETAMRNLENSDDDLESVG